MVETGTSGLIYNECKGQYLSNGAVFPSWGGWKTENTSLVWSSLFSLKFVKTLRKAVGEETWPY